MSDDVRRNDRGLFVHKQYLPVSEVCFGYSPTGKSRYARVTIGELICAPDQFGMSLFRSFDNDYYFNKELLAKYFLYLSCF